MKCDALIIKEWKKGGGYYADYSDCGEDNKNYPVFLHHGIHKVILTLVWGNLKEYICFMSEVPRGGFDTSPLGIPEASFSRQEVAMYVIIMGYMVTTLAGVAGGSYLIESGALDGTVVSFAQSKDISREAVRVTSAMGSGLSALAGYSYLAHKTINSRLFNS